jgi:hypothetical protein
MKKQHRHLLSAAAGMFFILWISAAQVFAALPLITDDTGTQGKGKSQIEICSQWGFDRETDDSSGTSVTTKSRQGEVKAQFAYGFIESADLILGVPYQWKKTETDNETTSNVNGVADLSLEVKWRFYEKDGLSFAFKPGVTLPAGDKEKNLGTGRATGTFFFITSKDWEFWTVHANLGYKRNENNLDQREDIWHASIAGEWKVVKDFRVVANIGAERNPDKASQTNPAFALGGFIYALSKDIDISIGLKGGLNKAEMDYTALGGITLRF